MRGSGVRLILIRHGESVLGRAGRYAGHRDTPLTPKGRLQARSLRRRFARLAPDRIYSSDLLRCRQTAAILAPGRAVTMTPKLRELDFGRWDGRSADECRRLHASRFGLWLQDPARQAPPGGESLRHLRSRVRTYVSTLAGRHPGAKVAFVTHAGPIRALLSDRAGDFWRFRVNPASVHEIDWPSARR